MKAANKTDSSSGKLRCKQTEMNVAYFQKVKMIERLNGKDTGKNGKLLLKKQ